MTDKDHSATDAAISTINSTDASAVQCATDVNIEAARIYPLNRPTLHAKPLVWSELVVIHEFYNGELVLQSIAITPVGQIKIRATQAKDKGEITYSIVVAPFDLSDVIIKRFATFEEAAEQAKFLLDRALNDLVDLGVVVSFKTK